MPEWRKCFAYLEIYKHMLGVAMVIGFLSYEAKGNSDCYRLGSLEADSETGDLPAGRL